MRGAKTFGIILTTVVQGPESNVNPGYSPESSNASCKEYTQLTRINQLPVSFYSSKLLPPQAIHTLGTWNTGNWLKASWDNGPILRVNKHYQSCYWRGWLKLCVSEINKSNAVAPMHCNFNQDCCATCSMWKLRKLLWNKWMCDSQVIVNDEIKVDNWSKCMHALTPKVFMFEVKKQAATSVSWSFHQVYTTDQCTDLSVPGKNLTTLKSTTHLRTNAIAWFKRQTNTTDVQK